MGGRFARTLAVFGIVALAACSGNGIATSALPAASLSGDTTMLRPENGYYPMARPNAAKPLCATGRVRCMAIIRTDLVAGPPAVAAGIPSGIGYTPSDIQAAYDLDSSKGEGQTIAIVDAFGYPTAAGDLAVFRKAAGLPACTVTSGCLRIRNQDGLTAPLPALNEEWAGEQSLDLDAVSGVCPKCHILLIEGNDTSSMGAAEYTAARLGGDVISNSYGFTESSPALPADFNLPGHLIVASSGDNGGGNEIAGTDYRGGPMMPCTYSTVVCAGGTRLTHDGTRWSSSAWNDLRSLACGAPAGLCGATGSGCSRVVPKPAWQTDKGCRMRSASDVSADASVFTPYAVYNSLFRTEYGNPWQGFGGTSLSSPLIAGIFALAGNARSRHGAMELWQRHDELTDVLEGNNLYAPVSGPCASAVAYICFAGAGYDGPTGWGTPHGTQAF